MAHMDMELKKAFTEMQVNKIEATKKVRILDIQTETLKKTKQRFEITEKEVSQLDPNTKVYSSVGRMFVLSNVPELKEDLKAKQEKVQSVILQCDKNKDFLINNLKGQEDALREMVQLKKDTK